jgi:ribonuclease HII
MKLQLSPLLKHLKLKPLKRIDWRLIAPGPVIGVDEVGRGCLAGPVYAAAVILDSTLKTSQFTDSKLLSARRREVLAAEIHRDHRVGIGFASVEEIDQINILQASLLAMRRAILNLGAEIGHLLVDGVHRVCDLSAFAQTTLIQGDLRAEPVGAASIVAKVTRDKLLTQMAEQFPNYGFENHKGYATQDHRDALLKWGPCRHHRRTFAGCESEPSASRN